MRNKALENPDFPNEELINEYLVKKDNVSELNISWQQPDMVRFMVGEKYQLILFNNNLLLTRKNLKFEFISS